MARQSRAHVTVNGIARLKKRLEDLPDEIRQALAKGVQKSAEAIAEDVARNVPVDTSGRDTHHLKDTVGIKYREDGLIAAIGWFDQQDYYALFVEHGTRSQPPQPSLGPALQREKGRYASRLTDEVRQALR
ncbi:HK97-gp10 family putative phage morphogenesis protein [Streptomyces sp. NPDC101455]|uniref:HK97-gp10 family putative phage morphogenesis protein n=1 Tax=Streptomyces sp. NPDC101455 TaxID=3366142 RepID=UPI0037F1D0C7